MSNEWIARLPWEHTCPPNPQADDKSKIFEFADLLPNLTGIKVHRRSNDLNMAFLIAMEVQKDLFSSFSTKQLGEHRSCSALVCGSDYLLFCGLYLLYLAPYHPHSCIRAPVCLDTILRTRTAGDPSLSDILRGGGVLWVFGTDPYDPLHTGNNCAEPPW